MDTGCELILPCRDEAPALERLLPLVPPGMAVVVVDNGSADDTALVAARWGARVVTEPRAGYGAAVHAGVLAATADVVAVTDGDGSVDPRELPRLVAEVAAGRADLVVGRRRPVSPAAWPWPARAGNAVVAAWLRRRLGVRVHDLAPVRVCRRRDLIDLGVTDRRFGYPVEVLQRAHRAGWRIAERDVAYHPRAEGTRSKVTGSVRGTLRTVRDVWGVLS